MTKRPQLIIGAVILLSALAGAILHTTAVKSRPLDDERVKLMGFDNVRITQDDLGNTCSCIGGPYGNYKS